MKKFYCKRCEEKIYRTRWHLRKHLREEHLIKKEIRSFKLKRGIKVQSWWGEEEF